MTNRLVRHDVQRGPAGGAAGWRPRVLTGALVFLLGAGLSASGAEGSLYWTWASPLPQGNNAYELAFGQGLYVMAGDRGQLYTSRDLGFWVPRATRTTKALRGIAFLGDRLIVTGEEGTVLCGSVTNLDQLTLKSLGTTDWLEGVAASAQLAVAVGDNGAIYASTDGTNWTRRTTSVSTWLRSVAYSGTAWVAVGERGFIANSLDTQRWVTRSSGDTVDLNRVVWLTNRFGVVGNAGKVLASYDASGAGWVPINQPNPPTNNLYAAAGDLSVGAPSLLVAGAGELRHLTFSGTGWANQLTANPLYPAPNWTYYSALWDSSLFLVGGRTGMLVEGFKTNSAGPYLWITRTDPVRQWLWDIAAVGELYVTVGDFGTVQTSTRGSEWALEVVPTSLTNTVLLGVAAAPQAIVSVGTAGAMLISQDVLTNLVLTNASGVVQTQRVSTLGVVWEEVQPRATTNDLQGVAFGQGVWVAAGAQGTVLTSPDALRWTARSSGVTNYLSGVAAFPGGLVAVGQQGTVLTSTDAVTWTRRLANTTNWLYRVRYLGGRLVCVGENGAIHTSPDGAAWTAAASGSTSWLSDAAWLDGTYYAVGAQGTVLASATAANWQSVGSITLKSLYGAVARDHQLTAVGVEGVILRGQASPLNVLGYSRDQGTNTFLFYGTPGLRFAVQHGSDLAHWTNTATLQVLDNAAVVIHQDTATNPPAADYYRTVSPP